jgi:hypothetical protein
MKPFLFILSIIVSASICAQDPDETKIRKLLDKQTKAWNNGDLIGFMDGYWENDSLSFIGQTGITYGWNNVLENYKKGYPDTAAMGKLAFTLISVKRLSSEYFSVIGKWELFRTIGNFSGHYTLLLRKINGKWVIISDHSS